VERVERLLLELAHAFGTNAEVGAEAAQRLHRPVEAIECRIPARRTPETRS
jgi:hypothetical protein